MLKKICFVLAIFLIGLAVFLARATYQIKVAKNAPIPNKVQIYASSTPSGLNRTTEQGNGIWTGYPQLKMICSCESAFGGPNNEPRQFDSNGAMIVGKPNPADWGACQINSTLWQKIAMTLGYDIKTYAGNIGFAKWLYDKKGSSPWLWSAGCWKK